MKNFIFSIVALIILVASIMAADPPGKSSPMPPAVMAATAFVKTDLKIDQNEIGAESGTASMHVTKYTNARQTIYEPMPTVSPEIVLRA